MILYISEADQTEIREPASFAGRIIKQFYKMTFSICGVFFFVFFFGVCVCYLGFSVVFCSFVCSTA